jgi:hypothetical protein
MTVNQRKQLSNGYEKFFKFLLQDKDHVLDNILKIKAYLQIYFEGKPIKCNL